MTKAFSISKQQVVEAYKLVKSNAGSAGIDRQSLADFERSRKDNLYKIWNRLSSGSYFPPPVLGVDIPKKSGGTRTLGIPTVGDRIAQMVVKLTIEPKIEPHFLDPYIQYLAAKLWKEEFQLSLDEQQVINGQDFLDNIKSYSGGDFMNHQKIEEAVKAYNALISCYHNDEQQSTLSPR